MIKRFVLILVIALLSVVVLIVLIADSPLMDEATKFMLERVTEQEVAVESARLSFIPGFKLVIKGLTIKKPTGIVDFVSVSNIYLQGSILKLLRKEIYLNKLELSRGHLKVTKSEGVEKLVDPLLVPKGNHETAGSTEKPFPWTVSLKEARVKDGSITYVKEEGIDARVRHTVKIINAMVAITKGDITIKTLDCTYKSASASLTGVIKGCFTKDPYFSMHAEVIASLLQLQEMLPPPLAKVLSDSSGKLSLEADGHLSHLSLATTMKITPPFTSTYLPLTILLKGYLDQLDQVGLQNLEIVSPCGSMHGEGVIANPFSDKRWFEVEWDSHLESGCFRHLFRDKVEMVGAIPWSGEIAGNEKNFAASVEGDFSSLSFISPYLVDEPKAGIQSVSAQLSIKEDTLEISKARIDLHKSHFDFNASFFNIFDYPKTFEVGIRGNVLLPEVTAFFPILAKGKSKMKGETPLYVTVAGSYHREGLFEIREGIVKMLGSEINWGGDIDHAFSKSCNLSLNTRFALDIEEIVNHYTPASHKDWKLTNLPPLSLTINGPLDILTIKADSNLEGFEMKFPQAKIFTPPSGGSLQIEATIKSGTQVSLHNLALNFGGSHLNANGTIAYHTPDVIPLEIESKGILKADELLTFFPQESLKGFSMEGSVPFSTMLRVDPTSFVLETDMDITEALWAIPTLIEKARGVTNRAEFTIQKDKGVPFIEEKCEWVLESAKGLFSLKNLRKEPNSRLLTVKTSPIDLSTLKSLQYYHKDRLPTGKVAVDLEVLFNPSDILKSSVEGFIELKDISFPTNDTDCFINAQLFAKGNQLSIPPLTIKYRDSDINLNGNIFWGEETQVEGSLTSNFINVNDFLPIPRNRVSNEANPSQNDHGQLVKVVHTLLHYQPTLRITADIRNLLMSRQTIRDWKMQLTGAKGYYDIHDTFTTDEGENTIKAQISPTSYQSFKQSYYFDIHGFNISDVAQQLQWENVAITGKVNLSGKLEHSTMQGESFFNPNSLKGQLEITLSHGEIRKLALLRNILLLINLPTVKTVVPVLQDIFTFKTISQLAKTKGRIINLKTIPYERLQGSFSIKNGIATTEDLMLISDVLTLAASGMIDLPNQMLEGNIAARPFGSLRSLLAKAPMVGEKATDIQDKLFSTYFTIQGELGRPEVKTVMLQSVKEGFKKTFRRLADSIKPNGK